MICYCSFCSCQGGKQLQPKTVVAHRNSDQKRLDLLNQLDDPESKAYSIKLAESIIKTQAQLQLVLSGVEKKRRTRARRTVNINAPDLAPQSSGKTDIVPGPDHEFMDEEIDECEEFIDERIDECEKFMDEGIDEYEDHAASLEFPEDSCEPGTTEILIEDIESASDMPEEIVELHAQDNTDLDNPDSPDSGSVDDSDSEYMENLEYNSSVDVDVLPNSVMKLREEFLGGYRCPQTSPKNVQPVKLTPTEEASLAYYIGWWKGNSRDEAYDISRYLISNLTGMPLLSLHNVRKLAESVVHFRVVMVDMCPMSCLAYTGPYAQLSHCTHPKKNGICNNPRYRSDNNGEPTPLKKLPSRKQFAVLPVMAIIRALFANETSSKDMRHRDTCLKEALHLVGTAIKYQDFANSTSHRTQFQRMHLFQDPRDVAFAISSDGAQLTMKRQSSTWIVILIILNLPPHIRYKSNNVIMNLAIPGPNNPQNLDSFLYPLFQEMAKASEGIWMWDAVDSTAFCMRAYITLGLGDMPGSARLSGMAGHTAVHGDRFSHVEGAKTSDTNKKRIYYPMSPPEKEIYNKSRPTYDLNALPLRTHADYCETIGRLEAATSENERSRIAQQTGISRLSLCAASPAFQHPSFFPFDPFHLFYENCMAYIWELWVKVASNPIENIQIQKSHLQRIGEWLPPAMTTLPPAFCGPVRDVFLKNQSQYKIYEWMALVHWYITPMLIELRHVDGRIVDNFSQFSYIVEYAMTITGRSESDLASLHSRIVTFLTEYERVYVGNNPANVSRCRLCIFQLIHIPAHIRWNGSVRLGSQATVERSIGELGYRIRSQKAPFANLTRLIKERELIKILQLYYPKLTSLLAPPVTRTRTSPIKSKMFSRQLQKKKLLDETQKDLHELNAIKEWLGNTDILPKDCERWGKIRLNGYVLRCALFELPEEPPKRYYRWFKAEGKNNFGEALVFYRVHFEGVVKELVIFKPLIDIKIKSCASRIRGKWSKDIRIMEVSCITSIVGIWRIPNSEYVYILEKHPGLDVLMQHLPDLAETASEDATEEKEPEE